LLKSAVTISSFHAQIPKKSAAPIYRPNVPPDRGRLFMARVFPCHVTLGAGIATDDDWYPFCLIAHSSGYFGT